MVDESWLWNGRLGHLDFDNLVKISKKEVGRDLPKIVKPLNSVYNIVNMGRKLDPVLKQKNI